MELKERVKQRQNGLTKKVIVEEPSQFTGRKAQIRFNIHHQIFDLYDSVADNAKLAILALILISKLWKILPNDIQDLLSDEDREVIEYLVTRLESVTTRTTQELSKDAKAFIDKLLTRQTNIAQLVKVEE